MQIKILKNTVADGKNVAIGNIVDATPETARLLIALGKAEPYTPPKPTERKQEKRAPRKKAN